MHLSIYLSMDGWMDVSMLACLYACMYQWGVITQIMIAVYHKKFLDSPRLEVVGHLTCRALGST
jgi:hypothetical protein